MLNFDLENESVEKFLSTIEYKHDSKYEYFEECFAIHEFESKHKYLKLIQFFDELVHSKIQELIDNINNDDSDISYSYHRNFHMYERENSVQCRIKLLTNMRGITMFDDDDTVLSDSLSDISLESHNSFCFDSGKFYFLQDKIYEYIKVKFKQVNINWHLMEALFDLLARTKLNLTSYNYYFAKSAHTFVIFLYRSFHDSGKFKKIYKNLLSLLKNIYIVKLENFEIDPSIFEMENFKVEENNYKISKLLLGGIYDLYKHRKDDFDGFVLEDLLWALRSEEDMLINPNVSIF